MGEIRRITKKYYVRQIMSYWLVFYMLFCFGMPLRTAKAEVVMTSNPVGTVTVTPLNGGDFQDMTASNGAIGNFSDFDILGGHTVTCVQPSTTSQALFKVTGSATEIYGTFNANGGIWLVNTAGIVVGNGGVVNVNQFVASTLNILDADFTSGLATGNFPFTDGLTAGDVINDFGGSITAERIALIGKRVENRGLLTGNYVVMAAGENVFISENGPVLVEVTMPEQTPGSYDYIVDGSWGPMDCGEGDIVADHIILAAGDIWSTAIEGVETLRAEAKGNVNFNGDIHVEAGPGSEAVADVTIITGGNLDIDYDIEAEATGDGDFDAIAGITLQADGYININSDGSSTTEIKAKAEDGLRNYADVIIEAGGDVDVLAQNGDAKITAEADSDCKDGILNKANIEITGKKVYVKSENNGQGNDDSTVKAYAHDADENIASISITANGEENIGDVIIESDGKNGDNATVWAKAEQGMTNTATIDIEAKDDVRIKSDEEDAVVKAEARNDLDEDDLAGGSIEDLMNTATVNITATDEVEIKGEDDSSADATVTATAKNVIDIDPECEDCDVVLDLAIRDLTNTANITINGGGVEVKGLDKNSGAEATVKATASNEIKVDIDNWDCEATVNLDVTNLENNAGVTINANGEVCKINVKVEGDEGHGLVRAEAYNKLEVEHKGLWEDQGDWVDEGWWWCCHWHENWVWVENWVYYPVAPATVNLAVDGLDNTANVDISSANRDVIVRADEDKRNDPYTASVEAEAYNEFVMDFDETTTGNLTFNNFANTAGVVITAAENVKVLAEDGGYAGVRAYAWNGLEASDEASGTITADNITNDADIDITAVSGDVIVEADCGGDCSKAEIEAWASNEGSVFDIEFETEPLNITNTANIDITAGGDVEVKGKDCGEASIVAGATVGTSNTSGVTINGGGDVVVLSTNGGKALVEAYSAYASGSGNTANVDITADDGYVLVHAIGGRHSQKSGFTPSEASIEATAELAYTEDDAAGGSNSADITIVAKDVIEPADIDDDADNDADGDADSDLDGSVLVIAVEGGKAEIEAKAIEGDDNAAGVDITADGDVKVIALCDQPSEAEIMALAVDALNTNTADIAIDAGGDVVVLSKDGGQAQIEAIAKYASDSVNTANIDITANDGYVLVHAIGGTYNRKQGFMPSEASIEATAEYAGDEGDIGSNTADITIVAKDVPEEVIYLDTDADSDFDIALDTDADNDKDGDVMVIAVNGGKAEIEAKAMYGDDNAASVDITADGDVKVIALCDQPSEAEIMALAKYAHNTNTADITIDAGGDVEVKAKDRGEAEIEAIAADGWKTAAVATSAFADTDDDGDADGDADSDDDYFGPVNTASVTIDAGDDVKVIGKEGGKAEIEAKAMYGDDNAAGVDITADGDVKVIAACKNRSSEASITAEAEYGMSNTATIDITAVEDVKVIGKDGGDAEIAAEAKFAYNDNTADVAIDAGGDVKVIAACKDQSSEASITAEAENGYENNASVALGGPGHKIGGDVLVIAKEGGEAEISATAKGHDNSNTADVLICTEGELVVLAEEGQEGGTTFGALGGQGGQGGHGRGTSASIDAIAENGYENTASVGIGAEDGIMVMATGDHTDASISSIAENDHRNKGYSNEADLIACTKGDLWVIGMNGGNAEIASEAKHGYITDAYTATCATGDIIVAAVDCGQQFSTGGGKKGGGTSAEISAEADSKSCGEYDEMSTANAAVHVVSKEGGVAVVALGGCQSPTVEAGIKSKAEGGEINTAYTGVAAGADLAYIPAPAGYEEPARTLGGFPLEDLLVGNVLVLALGNGEAKISSIAKKGYDNSAMTVVCALGKIFVMGLGGEAEIFSGAFGKGENSAQTKVFASELELMGNGYLKAITPTSYVSLSDLCITPSGKVAYDSGGDGSALIIVGDYASREDCPTCPPCPCEEGPPPPPPAPLNAMQLEALRQQVPEVAGCPAIMAAAADELGIEDSEIEVMVANAMAAAGDIQPCDTCARLVNAAAILRDDDGSRMAALAEVLNTVAPADVPFTPEVGTLIAAAFEGHAGDGTAYATALEYVDAFVEYVRVLDTEMGSPVGDSVEFAMEKYGAGINASPNDNVAAYVASRLEAIGG